MASETTPPVAKLPRRRNGREQACEPCRKSKMRCDHTLPTCLNCERRKLLEKCIYLPAPDTRMNVRGSISTLVSSTRSASLNESRSSSASVFLSPPGTSDDEEEEEDNVILKPSSGFYGPTSFSAVFLDGEDGLGTNVASPSREEEQPQFPFEPQAAEEQSMRMSLAMKVLTQLPNEETCRLLMEVYTAERFQGIDKGFHQPTVIHCMASVWSTFGVALRSPRNPQNLKEMAKILDRNTKSVLRDTHDGESWLASLSGWKLRWEMLGIIFATMGNTSLTMLDTASFWLTQVGARRSRVHFASEMGQCADKCVQLSTQKDNINYLMISLMFKRTVLESQCTGDTSLILWRQHGDLVAVTTGYGLHRLPDHKSEVSISSELRKRIWAVVFAIDKTLATFTGRPPGLSHRYSCCPLPLDLSDQILLAGKEEIAQAVSELDPQGWNTKGELYTATNLRANMIHALILSEILEIALGNSTQYSEEILMDIKRRNEESLTRYPQWLHFTRESSPVQALQWTRLTLRFRYLNCCLLIEQLATKRGNSSKQHLLDVAREMLELIVLLWTERDKYREGHYDYDFAIMFYGIPASGVICVELLRQIQYPRDTQIYLPRSEVIPNLSLLVGFLDWVLPTAPNREVCGRMRHAIKGILDRILDAPPALEFEPTFGDVNAGQMDFDDFNWLDSIDWARGPFVDLGMDGLDGYNNFP